MYFNSIVFQLRGNVLKTTMACIPHTFGANFIQFNFHNTEKLTYYKHSENDNNSNAPKKESFEKKIVFKTRVSLGCNILFSASL